MATGLNHDGTTARRSMKRRVAECGLRIQGGGDVEKVLLEVVAEKTGYPVGDAGVGYESGCGFGD